MKRRTIGFLKLLVFSILFWSVSFTVFTLIRYFAVNEEQGFIEDEMMQVPIYQWLDLALYLGVFIGLGYALVEFFFDKILDKNINLIVAAVIKFITYFIILIIVSTILSVSIEKRMDIDLPNDPGWWKTNRVFWLIAAYFFLSSLIFSFFRASSKILGSTMLINLFTGKYDKPREEHRILMFLDLKNSTTIAEQLGHFKYSKFIQSCFVDLDIVSRKFDAETYQYVGDEAVISWPFKEGLLNNNCIALFYAFKDRLIKRGRYYTKNFGVRPEFKAGVHGGNIVVTLIGLERKELAYHGDVINTTARIQEQCNAQNEELLISEHIVSQLKLKGRLTNKKIGAIHLKGKKEEISIHAISLGV